MKHSFKRKSPIEVRVEELERENERLRGVLERIVWLRISDPPAQVVAREALALLDSKDTPDA